MNQFASECTSYSGHDNLQVMAEAHNYNEYLTCLTARFAKGAPHLLDFGAGIGTFASKMREKGWSVSCVEQDNTQIKEIQSLGFKAFRSLDEIAHDSQYFIYSLNVLEHISDDNVIVNELFEVLKKGGRIFIYVPAFMILYSSMDRKVGHVRRYTRADLIRTLKTAGFHIETCRYADSLGFLATLVFKYFGNPAGDISLRGLRLYDRLVLPLSLFLDRFLGSLFGKNVYIVARRP